MNTELILKKVTRFLLGMITCCVMMLPSAIFSQNSPSYVKISVKETRLKIAPSQEAKVLAPVKEGTSFAIIQEKNGYYKVKFNNQEGWLYSQHCTSVVQPNLVSIAPSQNIVKKPTPTPNSVSVPASSRYELVGPSLPLIADLPKKDGVLSDGDEALVTQNTSTQNIFIYEYPRRESFAYPSQPVSKYPDLDISGFYETKLSGRNYNPKTVTDSRFETIRKDPIYNKLPGNVLLGEPKLENRYKFNIDGKLDKDLSVHYDVEQEPEFPGKYDIKVKQKNTELTFYHFDAEFKNGEFVNVRKALNGAMITSYTDDWETTVATGKQRSEPKRFESYGNSTRKYSLGNKSILEDSVRVWVNNVGQIAGRDFTMNFFEGEITFTDIKGPNDFIVVVYEFTNPIEDFLPVLARKNFLGGQFLWRSRSKVEEVRIQDKNSEILKAAGATPNAEFKLSRSPVIIGSDTVILNSRVLRRNKDYFLKANRSKIVVVPKLNVEDQLSISYDTYPTQNVSDEIIGKNSVGPYFLSKRNVVDGSAKIYVEDTLLHETRDYVLDYDQGKLYLNKSVDYPRVIHAEYDALKTTIIEPTKNNSPLSVGVTYLNEYSNPQSEKLVLRIASESITVTGNTFFTVNNPISTDNIALVINGQTISTSNFVVLNAYKGQIKINQSLTYPANAVLSYSYKKSYRTSFFFNGKTGQARYISNIDFELRNVPVKYKGIAYIRMRGADEKLLQPGREFEVDYGTDGQTLTIRFLTLQENPLSILTSYPAASDQLTVFYDYIPPDSLNQDTIAQSMIGITVGTKINKNWKVNAEIAAASNNLSKPLLDFKSSQAGTGVLNFSYDLGNVNIVENSEAVFLSNGAGSRVRQTKDKDYIINYVTGKLKFINLNPGTKDQIDYTYQYYDAKGTTQSGKGYDSKFATSLSTEYENKDVTVKGNFRTIDKDFLPIGQIQEKKGTTTFGGSLDWRVDKLNTLSGSYQRRDEFRGKKDNNENVYLHSDDINASAKLLNVYGWFDTTQTARVFLQIEDPFSQTTTINRHAIDELTLDYNGDVTFGPDYFKTTFNRGFSKKIGDYVDEQKRSVTLAEKTGIRSLIRKDDFYKFFINPFYEFGKSEFEEKDSINNKVSNSYSNRTFYGYESGISPLSYMPMKYNFSKEEAQSRSPQQVSPDIKILVNTYYETLFFPFSWISSGYNTSHKEAANPLVNQKGDIEDTRTIFIDKLAPYGAITMTGHDPNAFWLYPFRNFYVTYRNTDNDRSENNDRRKSQSRYLRHSYNNFDIFDGVSLKTVGFENQSFTGLNRDISASVSLNRSLTSSSKKDLSLSVAPRLWLLSLFSYNYGFEDRTNQSINEDQGLSTTTNRTTLTTPYFKRTQQLQFSPGQVIVPVPYFPFSLGTFSFGLSESLEDKIDSRFTETFPTYNASSSKYTSSIAQDNSRIKIYGAQTSMSPLNMFNLGGNYTLTDEYYSRNLITTTKGSTFKRTDLIQAKGDISPLSFLRFDGQIDYQDLVQYRSDSIFITLPQIKADNDTNTFGPNNLKDYLRSIQDTYFLGSTLTPFSWVSLTGSGTYKRFNETTKTSATPVVNFISQKIGSAGVIFRPLSGLSIAYSYSMKLSRDSSGQDSKGYTGSTSVAYSPFQSQGFKVNITYTRDDTWGRDINSLDKTATQQGSGDAIQTLIVDRSDSVELGVLGIDINIPITNNPVLDSLIITGEGYLKKVTDNLDPTKPVKRSYEISGMVIKGTLLF